MKRAILMAALVMVGLTGLNLPAQAGRVANPGSAFSTAAPYGAVYFSDEWFYGGQTATVRVIGDGDTRLFVEVFNEFGRRVDFDSGYICVLSWQPLVAGRYTIKVTNLGGVSNFFYMETN
jgi:hypothetical protein